MTVVNILLFQMDLLLLHAGSSLIIFFHARAKDIFTFK